MAQQSNDVGDQAVNLPQLVELMLTKRVLRVKTVLWVEDRAADTEVELSESAFRTAELGAPPPASDELCACGHPLYDHTQAGCVHPGCEPDGCGREEAKE